MSPKSPKAQSKLVPALDATARLLQQDLGRTFNHGQSAGLAAHAEITAASTSRKSGVFYRHLGPLRLELSTILAQGYRRYFKLALANPRDIDSDPDEWTRVQLKPAVEAVLSFIRDWYILACDGQNQSVRLMSSTEWVSGGSTSVSIPLAAPPPLLPESWRAPGWLFSVSPLVGIGPLNEEDLPKTGPDQELSAVHTDMILDGAQESFLVQLVDVVEKVRDEEIAAAGATATTTVSQKNPKGFEGLGPKKVDLSMYMDDMTGPQQVAYSLKHEYGLRVTEVASRMELDRSTVYEHLELAQRKVDQALSKQKSARRAKSSPE